MQERIDAELALLRQFHPDLRYVAEGQWMCLPGYPLPSGWSADRIAVAWQVPPGYPGTPPYGIYVPAGLLFKGGRPNNYTEPAGAQPPFGGRWGIFSWAPADGQWCPRADLRRGVNLLTWILGFAERFREGT